MTNGRIITGPYKVIVPSGTTVSGGNANSFVVGNYQRFVAAGNSTVAFAVGTNGVFTQAFNRRHRRVGCIRSGRRPKQSRWRWR